MHRLLWLPSLAFLTLVQSVHGQLRDIDVAGLPSNVTDVYRTILPYNETLRNYTATWTNPTPKSIVTKQFSDALKTFEGAQHASPENIELALLTGLTAHLAYNLDIESAYPVAVDMLGAAAKLSSRDPRPGWFLGIHECETAHPVPGMERLLKVEASQGTLPLDFWRDYALCSQIVNMPAHSARAFDLAAAEKNPLDSALSAMARRAIAPSDTGGKYVVAKTWSAAKDGEQVRFTSYLCGFAFATDASAEVNPHDVQNGTCAITITPPGYLREIKFHTPTLLILTQVVGESETLESFAERLAHVNSLHSKLTTLPCPVDRCLAYEIRKPDVYTEAGGAHILTVVFRSETPHYPGLLLETPMGPPAAESTTQYFRPNEMPHRFAGTMMTVVVMDCSEAIYPRSRADFEKLIKSMVVDH